MYEAYAVTNEKNNRIIITTNILANTAKSSRIAAAYTTTKMPQLYLTHQSHNQLTLSKQFKFIKRMSKKY